MSLLRVVHLHLRISQLDWGLISRKLELNQDRHWSTLGILLEHELHVCYKRILKDPIRLFQ